MNDTFAHAVNCLSCGQSYGQYGNTPICCGACGSINIFLGEELNLSYLSWSGHCAVTEEIRAALAASLAGFLSGTSRMGARFLMAG